MRLTAVVAVALVAVSTSSSSSMAAQSAQGLAIQSVTLEPDTGVIRIAGTGLGPDLAVVVDGQPVTVLPGATASQIEVLAPSTVVTTPGTFRLTVVDPVRQVGDAFVVVSQAGRVADGSPVPDRPAGGPATGDSGAPVAQAHAPMPGRAASTAPRPASGASPTLVIEDPGAPFRTAIGASALGSNTTGLYNTAAGYFALSTNTTGSFNTATGMEALRRNTGDYNTANGYWALEANTTGRFNTAIGMEALLKNSSAVYNTATGASALHENTLGIQNTATGVSALYNNTTGNNNTVSGFEALAFNTTGSNNVAVGSSAGYSATTGSYNVYLGNNVLGTAADTNTMRLGLPYNAGVGQNRTFIAGIRGTTVAGGEAVFIDPAGQLGSGPLPPPGANSVGSAQVIDDALTASDLAPNAVGTSELAADAVTAAKVAFPYAASTTEAGPATDVACSGCIAASEVGFTFASLGANTFTGTQTLASGNLDLAPSSATAGNLTKGGTRFLHTTGTDNVFLGALAGNFAVTGIGNTAVGVQALTSNTTGEGNVATGYVALSANTTGLLNTASGTATLRDNTTGIANTATGAGTLTFNISGDSNTATGVNALSSNTTGSANTASGLYALSNNTTGNENAAYGPYALLVTTGSSNTALGYAAGANATSGTYNVFLGSNAVGTAVDTNTMRLGLPYDSAGGAGQNRTFIAGIAGTMLTGPVAPVYIDANGQLGTLTPPPISGGVTPGAPPQSQPASVSRQLEEQQRLIEDLQARLAVLEAERASRPRRR